MHVRDDGDKAVAVDFANDTVEGDVFNATDVSDVLAAVIGVELLDMHEQCDLPGGFD
jgi:hypothetical protein